MHTWIHSSRHLICSVFFTLVIPVRSECHTLLLYFALLWLMMLSIFLGAFLPFIYFLWWSVCSNLCLFLSWIIFFWVLRVFKTYFTDSGALDRYDLQIFFLSLWPRDIACHYCVSYWGFEMSSFQPGENKAVNLSLFSFLSEETEAWGLWANDLLTISLKFYNSIGFSINNMKVTMPHFSKGTVTLISQIRKAKEILVFPVSHKDMAENTFSICS